MLMSILELESAEILSSLSAIPLMILILPALFLANIFGLEPSWINSIIVVAIYWYLSACLIILIHEKLKLLKFGKFIIVTIPIIAVFFYFLILTINLPNGGRSINGRIRADMNQIRSEAQIVELETNSYADVCANDDIVDLITDIDKNAPIPASCFAEEDAYCVTVELNSGDFYCVDSDLRSISGASNACTEENKSCK